MTHPDLREVPTYETWRKISELRNNPTQGSRWPTSKPTRTTSYQLINIMKVEMFSNRHGPFFKWKLSREIVSWRASDTDCNMCHTVSFTTQHCGIASNRCQVVSLPTYNTCRWRIDSWQPTRCLHQRQCHTLAQPPRMSRALCYYYYLTSRDYYCNKVSSKNHSALKGADSKMRGHQLCLLTWTIAVGVITGTKVVVFWIDGLYE